MADECNLGNHIVSLKIMVDDLTKALDFYLEIFQWISFYSDDDIAWIMAPSSPIIFLLKSKNFVRGNKSQIVIGVTHINMVLDKIIAQGGKIVSSVECLDSTNFLIAEFSDPFGNIIGLCEERR